MEYKISFATGSPAEIETFLRNIGLSVSDRIDYSHSHLTGSYLESWRCSLRNGDIDVGEVYFSIDTYDDKFHRCYITLTDIVLYEKINAVIEQAKKA